MLRRTILLGLAPAVAAAVCVLTAVRSPAADPPAEKAKLAIRPAGGATKPAGTLVERKLAAIRKINEHAQLLMQMGGRGPGLDFHYAWSKRQMEAEREAAAGAKERVAAAEGHLARMRVWEDRSRALQGAPIGVQGRSKELEHFMTEFYVAEAEHWLADARAAEKPPR
jgi:hypothetical protein